MTEYLPNLRHLIQAAKLNQAKKSLSVPTSRPDREQMDTLEMVALETDKKVFTPLLTHILSRETDKELLKRVIHTIGKHKLEPLIDGVSEFIFYDSSTLKSAAVKTLERIGTTCDLFLAHMTGVDFAWKVRDIYSPQELPIVISSLEKNLDQESLDQELKKAKINAFYEFPAKQNQIKSWMP